MGPLRLNGSSTDGEKAPCPDDLNQTSLWRPYEHP